MESRSPSTPGFTPTPFKISQCITPIDAKANVGGQSLVTQNKLSARRVGGC